MRLVGNTLHDTFLQGLQIDWDILSTFQKLDEKLNFYVNFSLR